MAAIDEAAEALESTQTGVSQPEESPASMTASVTSGVAGSQKESMEKKEEIKPMSSSEGSPVVSKSGMSKRIS